MSNDRTKESRSKDLQQEVKRAQALAATALLLASYRPGRPKAWYERGIIGDLTDLF